MRNPFPPMDLFSGDYIASIHEQSLDVLERLGMKILLPEARQLLKAGGARVDEAEEMVHIGREMVEAVMPIPAQPVSGNPSLRKTNAPRLITGGLKHWRISSASEVRKAAPRQ